jgi:hypothetical protein
MHSFETMWGMSVNKYLPHVLVLPEDDANRQLANGFLLNIVTRQVQALVEVGGWAQVRDRFVSDHIDGMRKYSDRFVVLLIDFDGHLNRLKTMKAAIPDDLLDRVFILGTLSEPELLRQAGLGSYEVIGKGMADDCRGGTQAIWSHDLLRHNEGELARLRVAACDVFFGS